MSGKVAADKPYTTFGRSLAKTEAAKHQRQTTWWTAGPGYEDRGQHKQHAVKIICQKIASLSYNFVVSTADNVGILNIADVQLDRTENNSIISSVETETNNNKPTNCDSPLLHMCVQGWLRGGGHVYWNRPRITNTL